jgi:Phage portal protein
MTPEQFGRLKSELEESFEGARNAGRPMLLEGGLDWKSMSLSPRDMDFLEAKNAAAREIALALGVPPMLLGIPGDNTYANFQEANRTFWRQTVLPLVKRTAQALSGWLTVGSSPSLTFKPDLDTIDALTGDRDALWTRLQATTFLTDDEKRAEVGYGPKTAVDIAQKAGFRPDQPRGDRGRWVDDGGGDGSEDPQSAAKRPGSGGKTPPGKPADAPPKPGDPPQYKTPKSGQSGKEGSKEIPSWAQGERPLVGEDGKTFAKRLMDKKYPEGKYDTGPASEFNQIKKHGDRNFD